MGENEKIITVNFICHKLNLSKKEGFEILRRFTNAFVQTKQINCFLLKQITGKKNNKSSCSLVKSCDLEEEKKLFQSIDCISDFGIAPSQSFIFEAACDSHQATFYTAKIKSDQKLINTEKSWKDKVRIILGYWYSSRYKQIVRKYRNLVSRRDPDKKRKKKQKVIQKIKYEDYDDYHKSQIAKRERDELEKALKESNKLAMAQA